MGFEPRIHRLQKLLHMYLNQILLRHIDVNKTIINIIINNTDKI